MMRIIGLIKTVITLAAAAGVVYVVWYLFF